MPEDDQLFIGLSAINYVDQPAGQHFEQTQEEVEAALATAPNGALFGSSFHRTHMPVGLWVWNSFHDTHTVMGKWVLKNFAQEPVLMSRVYPALRAQVAQNVLRQKGFFRAKVDYEKVETKNPKTAKIAYTIDPGPLFTINSLDYIGFPAVPDSIIRSTLNKALIHEGDPFDIAKISAERERVTRLLRNKGFYYYQSSCSSYLADTVRTKGKVDLRLGAVDSLPASTYQQWKIGKVDFLFRKTFNEQLTDSVSRRFLTVRYNGKKPPLRPRVILSEMRMRPGRYFSIDDYEETLNRISSNGLFSMVDLKCTPENGSDTCSTLNLELNCVFEKPWDAYFKANVTGKTNGRVDPEVVLGLTRLNAFHGGEKIDFNVYGSYEWQTGHPEDASSSGVNSYEYGASASVTFPRMIVPWIKRRRYYSTPSTTFKASTDILNRSGYFTRQVFSAEVTYKLQPNKKWLHQISPLIMQYEYMRHTTSKFNAVLQTSPYLKVTMADRFTPKLRYNVQFVSGSKWTNPISWSVTFSESANFLSLIYAAAGKGLGEKNKKLFGNPYSQFVKGEADFKKTWQLSQHDALVFHAGGGVVYSYGNSTASPYSEQFYVGGANSIRAFNVRAVGPGEFKAKGANSSYMDQTGDIKAQMNIEYRPRLFGSLYGAVFLDAGNVWAIRDDGYRQNSQFKLTNLFKQMALGTGLGIRYDLDFFVLRLDWGYALHVPYRSGFINPGRFKNANCLHLAIGYPF